MLWGAGPAGVSATPWQPRITPLLFHGQVRKWCYRTATQRDFFAPPLEMERVLLSSHLLCFVLALGSDPHPPSAARDASGPGVSSNLPSLAQQPPGTLCHASAFPSSCLPLCFVLESFCNITGTLKEGRRRNNTLNIVPCNEAGRDQTASQEHRV